MVRLTVSRSLLPAVLLVSAAFLASELPAAGPATSRKSQVEFGVDMAKRGLWSEALFRFENARKIEPNDAAVLNNLAVCYEAAGRFEDALTTYEAALAIDPGNRALRQNYSRFAEFYQDFRPKPAAPAAAPANGESPAAEPAAEAPPEAPQDPPAGGAR